MNRALIIAFLAASAVPLWAQEPAIPSKDDLDVGLYIRKGTAWEPLLSEVVTWKTGGVLKSMATYGIVKGDVNGHLAGNHSRNLISASANAPVEVLIYAPEGVEYTEYQLIRLHENSHDREFRTTTGGVFHSSGGATRDVVPFDAKKVAKRMWTVTLPTTLKTGEYGFLPPGAFLSANSASIGKMYTFELRE